MTFSPFLGPAIENTARVLSRGGKLALDALMPPQCPVTGEAVAAPGLLSASGWASMRFIDDPVCARCGVPFAHDYGEGAQCAACIASSPGFARARAAVAYDDASHRMIVSFKYSDRTEHAPMFGQWLARAGRGMITADTIIAPVPLHRRRLAARRYNQAGLLAGALAKHVSGRLEMNLLRRVRRTIPQVTLSPDARRRNVAGAFAVTEAGRDMVRGAEIVLVDDVLTTGATLTACARALKRAGAETVNALVLARVVKGGADAI